jgi:hypothetical protein
MLCFNQHTAHAQTITGNIGGTVTDLTGAVVPNASITVTNVANGFVFTTTSNSTGNYDVRFLPIGQYKVVISASGFGEKEYGPFSLEIGQDAKINAVLKVRSATVNIEVQAAYIPLLNTEDNVIGETLTSNAIQTFL